MRLETTSSTVHRRGGNPGEKLVRGMLEKQSVHEGKKTNSMDVALALLWCSGWGGRSLRLVETRERVGGRMQREEASLPHCRGKCCFWGSSGGLLLCQIYAAAEPHSVLAPMLITGRKPEPRGEAWGKGQYPR